LAALSGVGLWQEGDGKETFVFDVDDCRRVAEVVRPHLSPEGRAQLAGRMWAANASRRQALPAQ
jgi:hypothetical protein